MQWDATDADAAGDIAFEAQHSAISTPGLNLRNHSSAWAREICSQFPDLDGLAYRAAMEGGLAVALFFPAADAMPTSVVTSRALNDPALASRIAGVCDRIGYRPVGAG